MIKRLLIWMFTPGIVASVCLTVYNLYFVFIILSYCLLTLGITLFMVQVDKELQQYFKPKEGARAKFVYPEKKEIKNV